MTTPAPKPWRWRCNGCGHSITRPQAGCHFDPCAKCGSINWEFWQVGKAKNRGQFYISGISISVTKGGRQS